MQSSSLSESRQNDMIKAAVRRFLEDMSVNIPNKHSFDEASTGTVETEPMSPETSVRSLSSESRRSSRSKIGKRPSREKRKSKSKKEKYIEKHPMIKIVNARKKQLSDLDEESVSIDIDYDRISPRSIRRVSDLTIGALPNVSEFTEWSDPFEYEVGNNEFHNDVVRSLGLKDNTIYIQSDDDSTVVATNTKIQEGDDLDFEAAFSPNEMRCLALVSHNEMKETMKDFVIQHKRILKKFRLTGTDSTMKMLEEVFADESNILFGPSCGSGSVGGDLELVTLMTSGQIGGILLFQDPMEPQSHNCDIQCLVRQALVHNILFASNSSTALAFMDVFKIALMGVGKAELIPSFFVGLQCPMAQAYKNNQTKLVQGR